MITHINSHNISRSTQISAVEIHCLNFILVLRIAKQNFFGEKLNCLRRTHYAIHQLVLIRCVINVMLECKRKILPKPMSHIYICRTTIQLEKTSATPIDLCLINIEYCYLIIPANTICLIRPG